MLFFVIPLLFLCGLATGDTSKTKTVVYDRYTAKPASRELLQKFKDSNITSTCTIEITTCNPKERRRVDGSCNNLKNPAKGTYFEPVRRFLPSVFTNGSESRKAADGSDLKPPRFIRTTLLFEGSASNYEFTTSLTIWSIWTFGDVASLHDLRKTLSTDCCSAAGRANKACRPTYVPVDDPTFRYAGVDCLNMTKPILYQDFGCTNDTKPSPIQRGTATYDLSHIYNAVGNGDKVVRAFKAGQLTVDVDSDGIIWPPNGDGYCPANQPGETRCFGNYATGLLQNMLISMWYMRQHNYFAKKLAELNPCWDDEMIFQTARDINIAFAYQLYYYEFLPLILGYENSIKAGIISENKTHRDLYDETVAPDVSLEYTYVIRWFHLTQQSQLALYDSDGHYLKSYPVTNTTFRPGFLDMPGPNGEKNVILFTKLMFKQSTGRFGPVIQPDMANRGQAYIQKEFDIPANDLHRGRYLGFQPYIKYVEKCFGRTIKSFEDLTEFADQERCDRLKLIYDKVEDIELLAGIWSEKNAEGGSIPATAACIIADQAKRAITFDRHWYERPNRPYPFTKKQLSQIRKSTLARLICNGADKVSEVQPSAFRVISKTNPLTPCSEIPSIDFKPWKDLRCEMETLDTNGDSTDSASEPSYDDSDDTTNYSTDNSTDTTSDDSTSESDDSDSSSTSDDDPTATSDDSTDTTNSDTSIDDSDDSATSDSESTDTTSADSTSTDSSDTASADSSDTTTN